jgi:uncharacterized membrane protein
MFNLSSLFDSLVGLFVLATISVIILLIIISILYIILFVVDLFDQKQAKRESEKWQEFEAIWQAEAEKHLKEYLESRGTRR